MDRSVCMKIEQWACFFKFTYAKYVEGIWVRGAVARLATKRQRFFSLLVYGHGLSCCDHVANIKQNRCPEVIKL